MAMMQEVKLITAIEFNYRRPTVKKQEKFMSNFDRRRFWHISTVENGDKKTINRINFVASHREKNEILLKKAENMQNYCFCCEDNIEK